VEVTAMAYDSKYKHGMSWLNDEEEDACAPKILKALYAAVYDENSDDVVVQLLLRAYDLQHPLDNKGAKEPKTLSGQDAWAFMKAKWAMVFKRELGRYGIPFDDDGVENSEVFDWPSSLPYDYPVRVGILKSVGERMGRADACLTKSLRDEAARSAA
jgi:hypothetical protein